MCFGAFFDVFEATLHSFWCATGVWTQINSKHTQVSMKLVFVCWVSADMADNIV